MNIFAPNDTSLLVRRFASVLALVALALAAAPSGCDGGREGDRCNPNLSHDECGDGLSCQTPGTCVENYCCPNPATSSSDPNCNGTACPVPAAGADDAGSTGSLDAGGD